MSNKSKLIVAILFSLQIVIVAWSFYQRSESNATFEAHFAPYVSNPLAVDSMDLSGLELEELIDSMFIFKNLEYLDLSNNNFNEIPEILFSLDKLKVLNVSHNKLNIVTLIRNHSIERLILNHNEIEAVNFISSLKELEYLDVSHNQLTDLPVVNFPIPEGQFDSLIVNHNKLYRFRDINRSILTKFEHLDLSHNNFQSISELDLIKDKVQSLDLSYNNFSQFPVDLINSGSTIKTLNLEGCHISRMVKPIDSLYVEHLNINKNDLEIYPDYFNLFLNLKSLNISGGQPKRLALNHSTLVELDIRDISFTEFVELDLPNLKTLTADFFTFENQGKALNLPNVKTINVHNFYIENDIIGLQKRFPNAKLNLFESEEY